MRKAWTTMIAWLVAACATTPGVTPPPPPPPPPPAAPTSAPAAAPTSAAASAPASAAREAEAADPLDAVRGLFPRGRVELAPGPRALRDRVGALFAAIGTDGNADVALVVDAAVSGGNLASALELALGPLRTFVAAGGRSGLVTFGRGADRGPPAARVLDLGADAHAVRRSVGRLDTAGSAATGLAPGIYGGLDEAVALAWRPGARRYLIVFTDDEVAGAADHRDAIAGWAAAWKATLFLVRCKLALRDGFGDDAEAAAAADPGLSPELVAGLFGDGADLPAGSPAALVAGMEHALERLGAGTPARIDLALVVDTSGAMGAALRDLAAAAPALERFAAPKGRRFALVTYGAAAPRRARALSAGSPAGALAALRPGMPGDWPKPLFQALEVARALAWAKDARKAIIVLTAAPAIPAAPVRAVVLDWTDTAGVAVRVLHPAW